MYIQVDLCTLKKLIWKRFGSTLPFNRHFQICMSTEFSATVIQCAVHHATVTQCAVHHATVTQCVVHHATVTQCAVHHTTVTRVQCIMPP